MKKILVVPTLLLAFACQDNSLVQPDRDLSIDTELAQSQASIMDSPRMVPWGAEGTWWVVGFDGDQCQGDPGLITYYMEADITATHMGRSHMDFSVCWTTVGEFVSGQGTFTAANGDELYYITTPETTHPNYPDGTWDFGPGLFDGGTGRFESAMGEYTGYGTSDGVTGGTLVFKGWISSVGSSK